MKVYNDKNVFDAAMERIEFAFDNFEQLCVSYSGGKDSTVMIQLVEMMAEKKNKQYDVNCAHFEKIFQKLGHILAVQLLLFLLSTPQYFQHHFLVPVQLARHFSPTNL